MELLKSIIDKISLKELCGILFFGTVIITFMPEKYVQLLGIATLRKTYQVHISLSMIMLGSFYLFRLIQFLMNSFLEIFLNKKRIALKYMKNDMTSDEMQLLLEVFFDSKNKKFHTTGQIDLSDGRKAALETKCVIYQASLVSSFYTTFDYNLQPYALELLNNNLKNGNIEIYSNSFKYHLK